ncbi:MAG: mechanosensitive ion channel family protein [Verrucomicrobiota bacterium]
MIPLNTAVEKTVALAVTIPVVYSITMLVGRFLRRRSGVKLGVMYRLFSIAISIFLPLLFLDINFHSDPFDLQRELEAVSILLGAFFLTALIRRYLWEGYFHKKRGTEIPKFLRELAALLVFLIAAVFVLDRIYGEGKAFAGLVAGSGVIAIILGFAMQDLLGNIISGIALEIGKPFRPGDWLLFETHHAEVIEINWRSTRLRTNDDICLDIPNNQIVRHTIVNLSYPEKIHSMRIVIGLDYNVPPNQVKEIIVNAAKESIGVLPAPVPKCFLKDFGDSAIQYELKFWMEDDALYNDIFDSIRTNIWYALKRHQIKIPFPVRTLQIERRDRFSREIPAAVRASLATQPLFQNLDEHQTNQLLSAAKLHRYGSGEKLIRQGTEGSSMYVLLDGNADVHVSHQGGSACVATLKAGDYFGEMSLLTGEKRSATVVAKSDCEVLEIGKTSFAEVLQSSETLLQKLSEMLAQRRLENEGVLAATSGPQTVATKQQEYAANFLARLSSFFDL